MIIITQAIDPEITDRIILRAISQVEAKVPSNILGVIAVLSDNVAPNLLTFDIEIVMDHVETYNLPLSINGYKTNVEIYTYSDVVVFKNT